MIENLMTSINTYFQKNIVENFSDYYQNPMKFIPLIIDIAIVIFVIYKFIKASKKTRVWQLLKGIVLYVIITALSSLMHLQILNYILTSFLSYGVIALIVIFQPELRRTLEQIGTNKITKFFGMEKDIQTKTKEDIYKIVIAVEE